MLLQRVGYAVRGNNKFKVAVYLICSWLRGTWYAEIHGKFKMAGFLKQLAMRYVGCRENKFKMMGFLKQLAAWYAASTICKRRSESITCIVCLFWLID